MRLLKRVLLFVLVLVIILLIVGCAGGYWFITKSHPQVEGTLQVKGLKSKVEIVRDAMGVAHIYADNVDDLFFAQGYVEAQDRLWQMEYNRRVGHGTLSEMFGAATIKQDRFLRTMGLGRSARADVAAMSDADKKPLQAFANGVTAFIDTHRDNLPLEFTILGVTPAPWEPADTVAWGKVMAYSLGGNYDAELARAAMIQAIGADKTKQLLPPYPATGPFTIPPEAKEYKSQLPITNYPIADISIGTPDLAGIVAFDASLGLRGEGIGSNNWVVDGTKSTTGKPILANDTHLGLQMPSIWYEIGLHCTPKSDACPYNVVGFTFPGVTGVIIGHNVRIAWGVTNAGPDVQDLFVEEINPQNPNQYKFNGKWEDFQVVEEPIKVKNVVSETLKVQVSRHGPIMTPVFGSGVTQPLALQWTALRDRSRLFESVLQIDRANNWDEFRAALKLWNVPSQNFVYADTDGNIGYQMPGNVPIRARGDGTVPAPGTGEYEWTGYILFDDLPFVYNPPTHFIASANQQIVPPTYKYLLGTDWAAPFREQRITDLLKAKDKLSIDDIKAVHADVYSLPLTQVQKSIVNVKPEGFLQTRALEFVKSWDGYLATDSVGASIMEATYLRLFENIFADKLPKDLLDTYRGASDYHRRVVIAMLDDPKNAWWGSAGRDAVVQKSYAEAIDWLGSQFGDAPGDWKYGRLHLTTFIHPLGSVQPLDLLFNAGGVATPGDQHTVFATRFSVSNNRYQTVHATSMRMIDDLSNLSNSLHTHTTGQSGQPLSKHFSDMILLWRDVKYAPMYFDRALLDKAKEGTLVLQP